MLEPKPCPANNCDAQLFGVSEFVFCPKCGKQNLNYTRIVQQAKAKGLGVVGSSSLRSQPEMDLESGVIKW